MPQFYTLLNSEILPRTQVIEVSTSLQIPSFHIIGLPGPEVSEAKDRIKSAIENSGHAFPRRKVVVNLSPASVRKQGTGLDLAMALAVMTAGEEPRPQAPARVFAWGELGLDGRVKRVGQLTRAVAAALSEQAELLLLPPDEYADLLSREEEFEDLWDSPTRVAPVPDLSSALRFCRGEHRAEELPRTVGARQQPATTGERRANSGVPALLPLSSELLRILAVSAGSRHHLLLLGPKGAGKSHALEWLQALQPEPDRETRRMQAYLSELSHKRLDTSVRRVGAQVKSASLIGSFRNSVLQPGEFSLAHGGMLLADEFPEWPRDAREALREPLERGWVTLTRVHGSAELPARFLFAANGNLCPCGGSFAEKTSTDVLPCRCLPHHRRAYLDRLSGPILDRIDLVYVLRPGESRDRGVRASLSLAEARKRTETLRHDEIARYGKPVGELNGAELEAILDENTETVRLLDRSGAGSLRDRHKTLRIALSLAHWDGLAWPNELHFVEARLYRGALLQRELDGGS